MQTISQGTPYAQAPAKPRTIMVKVPTRDFDIAESIGRRNGIATADAFNVSRVTSPLDEAIQFGYLGRMVRVNLAAPMAASSMAFLSSVYIDNGGGAGVATLRHQSTGFQISAAPFTQGHYPLLLPGGSDFNFDVSYVDSADYFSNVNNFRSSFGVYPDTSQHGDGASGEYFGETVESGFLRLQFTDIIVPPCQWSARNRDGGVWYDHSLTIPAATAPLVLAQNYFRKGWLVQNRSQGAISVVPDVGGMDADEDRGIALLAGEIYREMGAPVFIGEVYIFAAAEAAVLVKEMQ